MKNQTTGKITFYGTPYCPDCVRAKAYLDSIGCSYEYINLIEHEEAVEKVIEINKGYQSIPTIVFPDTTVLVEPSNEELEEKIQMLKQAHIIICHKQTQ